MLIATLSLFISMYPFLTYAPPNFNLSLIFCNGGGINVVGEADLQIEGGPIWTWVIVDGISHNALLGADFMRATNTTLNWATSTLTMGETSLPMTYARDLQLETLTLEFPLDHLLTEFDHVFYKEGTPLPECKLEPLIIDTGSLAPVYQRPYRTPLGKRPAVQTEIESLLALGIIEPSASPYSAPLLLLLKKDHMWRYVWDYRRLNQVTKMDRHPLPLIQDIFDQLGGGGPPFSLP